MYERFYSSPSVWDKAVFYWLFIGGAYDILTKGIYPRVTVVVPLLFVLYQAWNFFHNFYELQETSLIRRVGVKGERIPYEKITLITKGHEPSRFELLRRAYVVIEYRNRKGDPATLTLHPSDIDDFVRQLNDKRQLAAYRANI